MQQRAFKQLLSYFNWRFDKYRLCHPGLEPLLRVWSYLIPALWISVLKTCDTS